MRLEGRKRRVESEKGAMEHYSISNRFTLRCSDFISKNIIEEFAEWSIIAKGGN